MNALKYLGLFLILSIIGFLIRDYFFDFSLSQITNENTQFISRNIREQFYSHILFAISIGIIPLLYLIIKKMTKLNFMNQGSVSCGVIVVCGILLWQFRIVQLNSRLQKLSEFDIGNGIQRELNFDSLNFGRYLFIGFLIGTVLSILIFKNRNKTGTE
jgi:hypothetical protein